MRASRLTAAAMGVLGHVATNSLGANMPTGHTSALARAGYTPYAVLEVEGLQTYLFTRLGVGATSTNDGTPFR